MKLRSMHFFNGRRTLRNLASGAAWIHIGAAFALNLELQELSVVPKWTVALLDFVE